MKLLSNQLNAFLAIVDAGTAHAAAKQLHVTQTAVTARIQQLEQQVGNTLFLRSRQGMRLTDAGQNLLRYCRSAVELEGELFASLSGDAQMRRIRIMGPSSVLRARTVRQISEVASTFPNLRISINLADTCHGVEALKKGEADIALIERSQVPHEFESRLLKAERYVLVAPSKWKNRSLTKIVDSEPIVDFDEQDQMTFSFLRKYKLIGRQQPERHFANNTDALADLVSLGLGYSVLSDEFAKPLIQQKKLVRIGQDKFYDYQVALCWYARKHPGEEFKALLDQIR